MKLKVYIAFFILLVFCSCKKNKTTSPDFTPAPTPATNNSAFTCKDLPPTPLPFGWRDSTTNADHDVNTFMFNPVNFDEVVIVVNGDAFGYNKMYCYNIRTKKSTYLATLDIYPPSVNRFGWVVYSTVDYNIFKVKCNGDSVTQLTFNNSTKDPKWDYTGNNIYYYQSANNNIPSQLVRATSRGTGFNSIPMDVPNTAVFNNSNKIIYQRIKDNSTTLIMRDMNTYVETNLINGPYNPQSGNDYFDNLCLDNNDAFFYWANSAGVFRCEISSLRIDTVLKNCANVIYLNPVFQSSRPTELLVGCHFLLPQLPFTLLHLYKPVEVDLVTKEMTVLDIYP